MDGKVMGRIPRQFFLATNDLSEIREIWKFIHFISHELPDPVIPENQLVKTVAELKRDMEGLKRLSLSQNRHPEEPPVS